MIRLFRRTILCSLSLLLAGSVLAQAPSWPAKPARMIVPWAPGGSTDVLARILAQKMTETWGQPFLVENRPGASGNIGSDAVAKAPADGYTILVGSMSTHAMNGALYAKMPFRPVEDFAPVALLAYVTNVLVAHPSVPANSVKELIALAKAKPGQVSYASAGPGSTNHLSAALFTKMAGVEMLHVPYKGGAPAVTDTVSGQVNIFFTGSTNVIEHVKAGRLKFLGVTESQRAKILPNVPTVAETLPGYEMAVWYGMFLPAGSPADVVNKLNAEANRILALPDVNARLLGLGAEPVAKTPQEFARILHDDEAKWGRIIREIGARAD